MAVVAVLPAMALVSAVGPATPTLRQVWTVPGSSQVESVPAGEYAVDEHRLYLVTPGRLAAYRLADGRVEWQAELPASDDEQVSVGLVAGLPMVSIYGATSRTVAFQPDSGQERWRHPGAPSGDAVGALMMLTITEDPAGRAEFSIAAVDPETGRDLGGVPLDVAEELWAVWQAPGGGLQLLTLARDGRLSRYDLTTGRPVETVRTSHAEAPDGSTNSLTVVEDMVVVGSQAGDPPAVAAYDPVTLTHRWTVLDFSWPTPCGRAACMHWRAAGGGSSRVRAVDPMTGEHRWSLDCAGDPAASVDCSVHTLEPADRMWVEKVNNWEDPDDFVTERFSSWIADTATGVRLTAPTDWRLRAEVGEAGLLLSRSEVSLGPGPPEEPSRVWWARSGVDLSRSRILGAVEADECDPQYPYLVCRSEGEDLTVWRVGP